MQFLEPHSKFFNVWLPICQPHSMEYLSVLANQWSLLFIFSFFGVYGRYYLRPIDLSFILTKYLGKLKKLNLWQRHRFYR